MEQRVSFITLAVRDLTVTRSFYVDGLGWSPELEVPEEVIMFRAGPQLVLSLWARSEFAGEVGEPYDGPGIVPITLAHNVRRPEEVDEVLALATRAGSPDVGAAQQREWGGYTGYFADPDGFRWEIAHNPGPIGQSVLPDQSGR